LVLVAAGCRTPLPEEQDTACESTEEIPYDDIDQDCNGADLTDVDGDGFDAEEAGGTDCDDEDATINSDAAETWYDGVDQDCDDLSDYDQDGDGDDHLDHGGSDCDDEDATIYATAEEIPYDDIDQDCDGADLTDVDGDGYEAEEVDGDDCDDEDATAYPDAPELADDGADNDCDGRIDEYLVCADGTGDFTTVQDGIDGVPNGAILELCPGTYEENITLADQAVNIEGGGDEPADVILRGVANGHITLGEGYVRLYWLAMEPREGGGGKAFSGMGNMTTLKMDTVDLCSPSEKYNSLLEGSGMEDVAIEITRCHLCYDEGDPVFAYVHFDGAYRFTMSRCVVELGETPTDYYYRFVGGTGTLEFSNNIFTGGSMQLGLSEHDSALLKIENNTYAEISHFFVGAAWSDSWCAESWPYTVRIRGNIFSGLVAPYGLWSAFQVSDVLGLADLNPDSFEANVLWDVDGNYGSHELVTCYTAISTSDTENVSAFMEAGSIIQDPLFVYDPGMGSYALDPASPAIDAGSGDPDPDGSPNDIGAFGGPDGDWYLEVPWVLP